MLAINIIKGSILATSMTLLLMAANMANAYEFEGDLPEVPTAAEYIKRGTVVTEDMLTQMAWKNERVPGYVVADKEEIIGLEANRNIRVGRPLYKRSFEEATLVKKGQIVPVVFKKGGIQLMTEGSVMADAAANTWVKVMNKDTKRILNGFVQKNGVIIVN